MTSIKKQVVVGGQVHYVEINSSLDLEEIEITGSDPVLGKIVHISLSSLLKPAQKQESSSLLENPPPSASFDMFNEIQGFSAAQPSLDNKALPNSSQQSSLASKSPESKSNEKEEVEDTLRGMYQH